MTKIEEYILLPKLARQAHLKLSEPCVERGGITEYRGVLAHAIDTTIPSGSTIQACHACNNRKCSNPYHLYWGTASENSMDVIASGGKTVWERSVAKHGLEKARELQRNEASRATGIPHQFFETFWLKKNGKERRIKQFRLAQAIADGWEKGRIIPSFNPKANVL